MRSFPHSNPSRSSISPARSVMRQPRTAVVTSADGNFRHRVQQTLTGLRWQVQEATSGAEAWAVSESTLPAALIVDSWLPDLDKSEFLRNFSATFPNVELLNADGTSAGDCPRGPHRQELLYALRSSQETDTAAWNANTMLEVNSSEIHSDMPPTHGMVTHVPLEVHLEETERPTSTAAPGSKGIVGERLPELVGNAPVMLEVSRRVRLIAPRATPVLIEGPTGSGKELVAEALHRLSRRSRKPFVAINCAAIPEALLEAELFGHTKGAFTGAVQGRVGRIESADGGTLFLDEIGEMPLSLQSKLLRFVESGELQRVGDNETVHVDVRIVAATHRKLGQLTESGAFRADLYYRLAVFLIRTPGLADHLEDLPLLVDHFLARLGRQMPVKQIDESAMEQLKLHTWPGNVRELEHVLERAAILAGDEPVLTSSEIDFGYAVA
ncbi:MAG: sigma-54-dependent Fis family transcriptional regulator [Acidobacteriota bacterium]|nr:sigma-54-dependent Fis family transcriptional regulator [Acidobacteriota bacterium]